MAEEYADKMARKTDAELRQYVTGRAQHRDDAVLAAFDELTRRGQPHPDDALVRPELEALVRAQTEAAQAEAEARQLAERDAIAEELPASAPELYSQGTIALFSILPTSMIGGGVLLGLNLLRLGRKRALLGLGLFMVVYLLVAANVITYMLLQGLNPFLGSLLFNVPAVVVYLRWFWPRYVHTEQYRSRGVIIPILVSFALIWGLRQALPCLIKQQPKEMQKEMEQIMKEQP